jgi:hypothetical protein
MNATITRIPEEQIEQAKTVDLLALAQRYGPMRRNSQRDWQGICPKCGQDFFHVYATTGGAWRWRCYECHDKPGDGIELVQWLQRGLTFPEAVAQLTGGAGLPALPTVQRKPQQAQAKPQSADWRRRTAATVAAAQERLLKAAGKPGQDYLLSRGIEPDTWLTFGLGYREDAPLPGTQGRQRKPAIAIPWQSRKHVYAIRYRFLEVHCYRDDAGKEREEKQTAEQGSVFTGKLYGGQGMPDWALLPVDGSCKPAEQLCTLVVCEGEINALSLWQVAHATRVHVLSLGSESAQLTPAMAQLAQRYGQVLTWADKELVAQRLMRALPGAVGIKSPGGKDANDLHQAGLLGGFLATVRADNAKSDDHREGLLWNLYDAAMLLAGIDGATATVLQRLATQLGRRAAIFEPEPNRWITTATRR